MVENKAKILISKYLPNSLLDKEKRPAFITLLLITLIMLIVEYFGWQGPFRDFYYQYPVLRIGPLPFMAQVFTSASFFLFLFIIPAIFHYLVPIDKVNLSGLNIPKWREAFIDYFPLVAIMLPALWFVTQDPQFNQFYPLYRPTSLKMLLVYEIVYLTQFISVEYFFRGFGLFRLERCFPGYGVAVMVLPYALIHIHKPFPEAIASIIAGLILGKLALKTGSVWPGVIVHGCIALSTDLFSLFHSGLLQLLH
jgi:uncharacterized protein